MDDQSTSSQSRPKTTLGTRLKHKMLEADAYVDNGVHVIFRERSSRREVVGIVLVTLGVLVLIFWHS